MYGFLAGLAAFMFAAMLWVIVDPTDKRYTRSTLILLTVLFVLLCAGSSYLWWLAGMPSLNSK
jgi:hypothetical protein